jgi:hypothetical protein
MNDLTDRLINKINALEARLARLESSDRKLGDIQLTLGDTAGANKLTLRNSTPTEVFAVDSLGKTITELIAAGTVSETAKGYDNFRMGVASGTPRIVIEDAGSTQWEIDNNAGQLRFFNPGAVKMTLDTNGNLITSGDLEVNGDYLTTGAATVGGDMIISGTLRVDTHEAWIAPTLTNSWVNFGGSQTPAGYWKDSFGIVHLRGLIKSGTAGAAAFTLPSGYRPAHNWIFATIYNSGADALAHIDLSTAGAVTPTVTASVWLSLDGLSFRTT